MLGTSHGQDPSKGSTIRHDRVGPTYPFGEADRPNFAVITSVVPSPPPAPRRRPPSPRWRWWLGAGAWTRRTGGWPRSGTPPCRRRSRYTRRSQARSRLHRGEVVRRRRATGSAGPVFADETLDERFSEQRAKGLESHLSVICDFWGTVLFCAGLHRGNAFQVHRQLNDRHPLGANHFSRWRAGLQEC